tara:strand:+ start:703 stop:1041 length:339 start_codon:yes stop_codon:yes gene_type:complete
MIILQESSSSQTISFIPREYSSGTTYNVKIVNESNGKTIYDVDTTSITENLYYNQYTAVLNLKQDNFYMLTITGSDVVYKDKIFCTNQTASSYSVNNNEYTQQTSSNEFIFI